MTPEQKKLGWALGLAAGAATVIGAVLLWPKKASAQTTPSQNTVTRIQFGTKPDTRDMTLRAGDEIHIDLPQQEGYVYDVVSHHNAVAQGIVRDTTAIIRAGQPGQAAVDVLRKAGQLVEGHVPLYGMRFNVTVSV